MGDQLSDLFGDRYFCSMCSGIFASKRTAAEALRETAEQTTVCAECLVWMQDVQRIAHRLAGQAHHDPYRVVDTEDGPAPLWSKYINMARILTTRKAPAWRWNAANPDAP
jgi:hypothetical protein